MMPLRHRCCHRWQEESWWLRALADFMTSRQKWWRWIIEYGGIFHLLRIEMKCHTTWADVETMPMYLLMKLYLLMDVILPYCGAPPAMPQCLSIDNKQAMRGFANRSRCRHEIISSAAALLFSKPALDINIAITLIWRKYRQPRRAFRLHDHCRLMLSDNHFRRAFRIYFDERSVYAGVS